MLVLSRDCLKQNLIQKLFCMAIKNGDPIIAIATVPKSVAIDVLRDFFTNCLIKKSDRIAIEMNANGGILDMFSRPNP